MKTSTTPKRLPRTILRWSLMLGLFAEITASAQITETYSFTNLNRSIPDGNLSGLAEFRTINSSLVSISAVKVKLQISGEFNGDLYGYLTHSSGFSILLNRPGKTSVNPIGYDDSGFNITLDDDAANDIHTYRAASVPLPGSSLTGTFQPDGRNTDPSLVTDGSARTAMLDSFQGLDATGEWVLYLVDVESGGTNQLTGWELEITGLATPSLTWANPADITYGTALGGSQLNASAGVPGTFVYSPPSGTILNAGSNQTLMVTFTPDDTDSYPVSQATVKLNVQRAPLTVTAQNKSKVYGAPLPQLTAVISGFVNGDAEADLDSPVSLATSATPSSNVAPYPITATGAADSNYTVAFVGGTLTINKASTTGLVSVSSNPAIPGNALILSMDIDAVAPGAGTPTGTVEFRTNGVALASAVSVVSGVASLANSTLPAGEYAISAVYSGDGNFQGTSAALGGTLLLNTPPVAGADVIERYPTAGVKVQTSTLLANDSDADGGDSITLNTIDSSSSAGGVITLSNGWVKYTPPTGFTNADSFTYSIVDERGAGATGTVTVTIILDQDLTENVSIEPLGGDSVRVRFMGIPEWAYTIQYSDNLEPADWQELTTVTTDAQGRGEFIDTVAGGSTRYYRTTRPITP